MDPNANLKEQAEILAELASKSYLAPKHTIYCLVDEKGKVVSKVYTQKRNVIAMQRRMPAYDAVKVYCPCDLSRIRELGEVVASRRCRASGIEPAKKSRRKTK